MGVPLMDSGVSCSAEAANLMRLPSSDASMFSSPPWAFILVSALRAPDIVRPSSVLDMIALKSILAFHFSTDPGGGNAMGG
eukprot:210611-Pyramimonas_sp.AAC.1